MKHTIILATALALGMARLSGAAAEEKNTALSGSMQSLTIEQAVRKALDYRPEVKKFKSQAKALGAKSVSVKKIPEPMISGSAGIPFTDPLSIPEASVMISQSFPLSNAPKHEGEIYEKEKTSVEWMAEVAALDIRYEVETQYIGIATMQEERKVLVDLLALAQQVVEASSLLVSSGSGEASMVSRAQVEVEQIKSDIKKLDESLAAEKVTFALMTGMDPAEAAGTLFTMPPHRDIDADLAKAFAQALEARPELKSLGGEIESTAAMKKAAKDGYYPMMTISAGYTYKNDELMGLMGKDLFMISAGITIPLWFKKYKAGVEEAEQTAAALGQEKKTQELMIKEEVVAATGRLKTLQAEIDSLDGSIIPQIRTTLDLQMASFSSGKGSLIDVIDSLGTLSMSLMKRATLEGEHAKARAAYYRAIAADDEGAWE